MTPPHPHRRPLAYYTRLRWAQALGPAFGCNVCVFLLLYVWPSHLRCTGTDFPLVGINKVHSFIQYVHIHKGHFTPPRHTYKKTDLWTPLWVLSFTSKLVWKLIGWHDAFSLTKFHFFTEGPSITFIHWLNITTGRPLCADCFWCERSFRRKHKTHQMNCWC